MLCSSSIARRGTFYHTAVNAKRYREKGGSQAAGTQAPSRGGGGGAAGTAKGMAAPCGVHGLSGMPRSKSLSAFSLATGDSLRGASPLGGVSGQGGAAALCCTQGRGASRRLSHAHTVVLNPQPPNQTGQGEHRAAPGRIVHKQLARASVTVARRRVTSWAAVAEARTARTRQQQTAHLARLHGRQRGRALAERSRMWMWGWGTSRRKSKEGFK